MNVVPTRLVFSMGKLCCRRTGRLLFVPPHFISPWHLQLRSYDFLCRFRSQRSGHALGSGIGAVCGGEATAGTSAALLLCVEFAFARHCSPVIDPFLELIRFSCPNSCRSCAEVLTLTFYGVSKSSGEP